MEHKAIKIIAIISFCFSLAVVIWISFDTFFPSLLSSEFGDSFEDYEVLEDLWYNNRNVSKATVKFDIWSQEFSTGKKVFIGIQYNNNGTWSDPSFHEIMYGYSIEDDERIHNFCSIQKTRDTVDNMTFWLGEHSIASDCFCFSFYGTVYDVDTYDVMMLEWGGTNEMFYRWTITNVVGGG